MCSDIFICCKQRLTDKIHIVAVESAGFDHENNYTVKDPVDYLRKFIIKYLDYSKSERRVDKSNFEVMTSDVTNQGNPYGCGWHVVLLFELILLHGLWKHPSMMKNIHHTYDMRRIKQFVFDIIEKSCNSW